MTLRTSNSLPKRSETRRSLDGLLAIGPHCVDAQLRALVGYAERTGHLIDVFWMILPGENPATDGPDSDIPIVVFDDDIAGFTPEEYDGNAAADESGPSNVVDWYVAHPVPQPKRPTLHLPVYGQPGRGERAVDAILCLGPESLDTQIARIEAYALRSAMRLQGMYVASGPTNLHVLLRDFAASNRLLGTGPTLTIGPNGEIVPHG